MKYSTTKRKPLRSILKVKNCFGLALFYCVFFSLPIFAKDCSCLKDFNYLVEKTEANYIGYHIKISKKNRTEYETLTSKLRKMAEITTEENCIFVLREWLSFFKDYHLFVVENPQFSDAEKQQFLLNTPTFSLGEKETKKHLQKNSKKLTQIEGSWYSKSERYAIIKDSKVNQKFIAVVLETSVETWKAGQIRAEFRQRPNGSYQTIYYMDDHSKRNVESALYKNVLLNVGIYGWGKTLPLGKNEENFLDSEDPQKPTLKIIDAKNILVSIPSFIDQSYRQILENLLKENHAKILASENLIIDLRGNSGGSRFDDLLTPYILTGKIRTNEANFALSSKDNIQYFKYLSRVSPTLGKRLAPIIERMEANPNKIVPYFEENFETPETIYPTPKNVAILIDKAVGSAAEAFVLDARQSPRVKLFGENTRGNIDYQQTTAIALKCKKRGLILGYPMYSRTRNLPFGAIDYIGISPDVRIAKNYNQIQFVVNYFAINSLKKLEKEN